MRTIGNLTVIPEYQHDAAREADIVVVPGGQTQNVGRDGIARLRRAAQRAEIVLSVCWGAFLLAAAGLLDGIRATTHRLALDGLEKAAPRCTIVREARFIDSGRIVTAAGVTAGIDGALHVVRRLLGEDTARWTAEEYLEHSCFREL